MKFLRKSLLRVYAVYFLLFSGLILIGGYALSSQDILSIPWYVLIGGLLVLSLFFLLLVWSSIVSPLRKVLVQMQSLLTGKPYRRIYSTRIDEIGVVAHFFNEVTRGLGEVSSEIKDHFRLRDELVIASELQRDILPLVSPDVPGLSIVAKNRPATELGGDSFNIFTLRNKTYIYLGDVTGHGVAAGLIMTMVNSLIGVFADMYDSPYEIVVHVNKYIKQHVKKAMFMTLVMLCFDHETKTLSYTGAGHEYVLLYHRDTGVCEAFLSGGVALGMVPDNRTLISEKKIPFNEGDLVVLYTDGITEAKGAGGELYGLQRVQEAIKEYAPQYSATGVNYHVAQDVTSFMGSVPQNDDMTLIVIQRTSTSDSSRDTSTTWLSGHADK